jgi:hypothetical protein
MTNKRVTQKRSLKKRGGFTTPSTLEYFRFSSGRTFMNNDFQKYINKIPGFCQLDKNMDMIHNVFDYSNYNIPSNIQKIDKLMKMVYCTIKYGKVSTEYTSPIYTKSILNRDLINKYISKVNIVIETILLNTEKNTDFLLNINNLISDENYKLYSEIETYKYGKEYKDQVDVFEHNVNQDITTIYDYINDPNNAMNRNEITLLRIQVNQLKNQHNNQHNSNYNPSFGGKRSKRSSRKKTRSSRKKRQI